MSDNSRGEDVGAKHGEADQIMDPHVVDNNKYEGRCAANACVVEDVILYPYFPDCLEFLGLVYVVLRDGRIGANLRGFNKHLAALCCVGVGGGYDNPYVVFGMSLVLDRLKEYGVEVLLDTNNIVDVGLSCDQDKGLSGLCQMEGKLFGQHGAAKKSMVIVVGLPAAATWATMFCMRWWHGLRFFFW